jgi:OOP family OmpA-OmpF porin
MGAIIIKTGKEEIMNYRSIARMVVIGMAACLLIATSSPAAEILTAEDFSQMIVTKQHLVKTADNGIILFDASSSMKRAYMETGRSMYEVAVEELKGAAARFPELGHNIGLYMYSRWKPVYPVQRFDRNTFAAALDTLPAEPKGPTLLMQGLVKLEPVLQGLSGKTVVFVYTDGTVTSFEGMKEPRIKARELAEKYDVCFYLISSATTAQNRKMLKDVAGINSCSRVIPFQTFIDHPEYNSGALFVVKSTVKIVTISDQKIVGLQADNIMFGFDKADIEEQGLQELDEIGMFLQKQPEAYLVIEGYADEVGDAEYNLQLSRRRAESAADYLMQKYNVDPSRMVVNWYGSTNPVAGNNTIEGRAQNRRVEIAVGGL